MKPIEVTTKLGNTYECYIMDNNIINPRYCPTRCRQYRHISNIMKQLGGSPSRLFMVTGFEDIDYYFIYLTTETPVVDDLVEEMVAKLEEIGYLKRSLNLTVHDDYSIIEQLHGYSCTIRLVKRNGQPVDVGDNPPSEE